MPTQKIEKPLTRQQRVGFPVFKPESKHYPHLNSVKGEKERQEKVKEYIKNALSYDPCSQRITGNTLFNDLIAEKTPKWTYLCQQILTREPSH